jgi:hypothetical protein
MESLVDRNPADGESSPSARFPSYEDITFSASRPVSSTIHGNITSEKKKKYVDWSAAVCGPFPRLKVWEWEFAGGRCRLSDSHLVGIIRLYKVGDDLRVKGIV